MVGPDAAAVAPGSVVADGAGDGRLAGRKGKEVDISVIGKNPSAIPRGRILSEGASLRRQVVTSRDAAAGAAKGVVRLNGRVGKDHRAAGAELVDAAAVASGGL